MPNKELSPERVLSILKDIKQAKINAKKYPTFVLLTELYKEYGKANIRPALLTLIKNKKIKKGHTMNNIYLDTI